MSLGKMAMKMAIGFAAVKGYKSFRQQGGLDGIKRMLSEGGSGSLRQSGGMAGGMSAATSGGRSGAGSGGGIGGILSALGGGASGSGGSSGLGGLLGSLGGGAGGGGAGRGGTSGMGGLLGGLAAMAGGSAALSAGSPEETMRHVEEGPSDEATAAVMIRAIGQAVRADGQIDAEERAVLDDMMDESETAEDRAALDAALSEPINPEKLARDVPKGHEAQVYAAALTAIDPDDAQERDFLKRFATALALDGPEVARLHEAAGKPV